MLIYNQSKGKKKIKRNPDEKDVYKRQAEQSLNSLKELSAPEAKVMRDGILKKIPAREVTIGDEVVLEAGDCVPADGKLLECASLKVDELSLIHILSGFTGCKGSVDGNASLE